jgi:L-alanine-DL-glutamate epimerase and related enzymes of enolase superfamily
VNVIADYLVGEDHIDRERHWSEMRRALRKYGRTGIGPLDIALWDFAGKCHDAPIQELLGTCRERLSTYASTYHSALNGGLDSPGAFADFAEDYADFAGAFADFAGAFADFAEASADSAGTFADFAEASAEECREMGYSGFKIHGWGGHDCDLDREVATVHAVGKRVGEEIDLMLDPACEDETFADTLRVGRACDEHGYVRYEDPSRDAGLSQYAH